MSDSGIFRMIGYERTDSINGPGFVLPLFRKKDGENETYVQVPDDHGRIEAFNFVYCNRIVSTDGPTAQAGMNLIHSFVDELGHLHCGTAEDLRSFLLSFKDTHQPYSGINCQIAELIGNKEEKLSARMELIELLQTYVGTKELEIFIAQSILRPQLWSKLQSMIKNQFLVDIIGLMKRDIRVKITTDNKVNVVLPLQIFKFLDEDTLSQLMREMNEEIRLCKKLLRIKDFSLQLEVTPTVVVDSKKVFGRQEDRISSLLKKYIEEYVAGQSPLDYYRLLKGTKFEYNAMNIVGNNLLRQQHHNISPDARGATNRRAREIKVANLIPQLYLSAYPFNRGNLLLSLASKLSEYPPVNAAIRSTLDRSNARTAAETREEIGALLNGPRTETS